VHYDMDPYNEHEALIELLQAYADKAIFSDIDAKMPEGVGRNAAHNLVLNAIEGAAAPFGAAMDAASAAGAKVTEKVQAEGKKLVDALRPILAKVVELAQSKMKKDEEKEEEKKESKEEKSVEVGDVVKQWHFAKTEIGSKMLKEFDGKKKPGDAIKDATDDLKKAISNGVRQPLEGIASKIHVPSGHAGRFVARAVERIVERITNLILELTTLDGFLESANEISTVVDGIEDALSKSGAEKAKVDQAINDGSTALWKNGTAKVAIQLFTRIWKLEEKIKSVMSGQPEEASAPLLELLNHIFEVQLRAFNGLRVAYIAKLRELAAEAKDADGLVQASRTALKTVIDPVLNLLAYHHWVKAHDAFFESAKVIIFNLFDNEVWPAVKTGLDAIQSLIPEDLGKMGLQIEPMARAIVHLMLNKLLVWAFKKVFCLFEKALFSQA